MTLRYAKIANRTGAEAYFAVADQVDDLYTAPAPGSACPGVTRLHRNPGQMLGNGWCAGPSELDCGYETICESCDFFTTGIAFRPTPASPTRRRRGQGTDLPATAFRPTPRRPQPGRLMTPRRPPP